MKRLYYITNDINEAERASDRLHEEGVTDWNFHVLGQDKAQIVKHHLHSTTPLHELDIIRSGERGVIAGFTIGILITGYITLFTPLGSSFNLLGQMMLVLLFSLFGAWVGGLVGVSNENYKIKRFHGDIKKGNYLLLVDVNRSQRQAVEDVIAEFSGIRKAGEDSTFINPFAGVLTH